MTALFPDTHPKVEDELIRLLRATPAWRKLEMIGQMNAAVKTMMLSGLRERYPEDSPALLRRRMTDLLLGSELAAQVYGPLEEEQDAIRTT